MLTCRVIVILLFFYGCICQIGSGFELLNADDHGHALRKLGRQGGSARPDITHQCLLMLLDSPLNRAGLLQVRKHVFSVLKFQITLFLSFTMMSRAQFIQQETRGVVESSFLIIAFNRELLWDFCIDSGFYAHGKERSH